MVKEIGCVFGVKTRVVKQTTGILGKKSDNSQEQIVRFWVENGDGQAKCKGQNNR